MYSDEIQRYLDNKDYKLTLEEYYELLKQMPQVASVKMEMSNDIYHKNMIHTTDGYSWGIYILNYGVDSKKLYEIQF